MRGAHSTRAVRGADVLERRSLSAGRPRPCVTEPECRKHVQGRRVGAAVVHGHLDEDVIRRSLGVLHEHVEVAILVEDPGVDQLVLELVARAPAVRRDDVAVGELALRVLVQQLQIGVGGRAVQVEPVVLGVLAVVPLAVRQAEHALLEDRIDAVPQGEREAQALTVVADPCDPVLSPAIGARARLVVREVVPCVAAGAVVLPHGAPLALAEVRAPREPRRSPRPILFKSIVLCCHGSSSCGRAHDLDRQVPRSVRPVDRVVVTLMG